MSAKIYCVQYGSVRNAYCSFNELVLCLAIFGLILELTVPVVVSAQQTANSLSFVDEPIGKLIKNIPDLAGIRLARDQGSLPFILMKTGERVSEYFDNLVDLVADERITQRRLATFGVSGAREPVRDSYLILRHGKRDRIEIDEFRMDQKGNRLNDVGQTTGFIVTSGFAFTCAIFSPNNQQESSLRYLGDQNISGRETYVVAFAQRPETN